jgi:hypothetical protein
LRVELEGGVWVRWFHGFIGVGGCLRGVWVSIDEGLGRGLVWIIVEDG